MSDIPIIRVDTGALGVLPTSDKQAYIEIPYEAEDPEEMLRWDQFLRWAERVLAVIGAGFLALTLAAGAGYWWARYGERQWIEAAQPKVETPCGSCRQGGVK